MSAKHDGFTIHELEELSGFDRRTIAYYTQEGLLPKIGRRGRGTVYPAAFKERLMFIRAVRNLQDAGSLRAVSLAEIKELMAAMNTQELLHLQKTADSETAIRALFHDPDWDTSGIAVPVEEVVSDSPERRSDVSGTSSKRGKNVSSSTRVSSATPRLDCADNSIQQLIQQIETAAIQHTRKSNATDTAITQLSVAELSAHISITVKGLGDEHSDLLVRLVEKLQETS